MQLNLKTLLIGGALLLFVFVIGPRFFGGGDATPSQEPSVAQVQPEPALPDAPAAVEPEPTLARAKASPTAKPPKPTAVAAAPAAGAAATAQPGAPAAPGQTWTVMLYQDADDKILEQDIYVDLNEAERVGPPTA